jgi:hypothetical protein
MKFGFVLPFGDARIAADLAREAELTGWDGFFMWEPICRVDAWIGLTAAAMQTSRIRLGTLLTPISRMRPWDVASKSATLDNLSAGRFILSIGLGAIGTGFAEFGEETDLKLRAQRVDEGLDIVTGLWQGQPFNYSGNHYHMQDVADAEPPRPVQQPRIPIGVVGTWPHTNSMTRALKYDGLIPQGMHGDSDAGYREFSVMMGVVSRRADETPFDVVIDYKVSQQQPRAEPNTLRRWSEAGATWWIEGLWEATEQTQVQQHILQGPPQYA